MGLTKRKAFRLLVRCEELGSRDAAIKILEVIAWHIKHNRTIPKLFRKYFVDCYRSIDFEEPNLNKAFHIVSHGKGNKVSKGKRFKTSMEILDYVDEMIKKDISKDKAFDIAGDEFGRTKKTVRNLYNIYRVDVYCIDGKLSPNQLAYVTNIISKEIDSFLFRNIGDN